MTAPAVPEGMKRCTVCGEIKPFSEFHRDAHAKDGLMCRCKACRKKYYEQNLEKMAEYHRKHYEQNREKQTEYSRKYHACVRRPSCPRVGGRGAEFITFTCEVCGTEFRRRKTKVDYDYEHRGILPRFCSNECKNAAKRKNYKSPYARKIEEIKKRLKN
jgi:hypothetical protein